MNQQKVSFEELFDHIKDDGVYLCEDTHTSYWSSFGGGYRRRGTFIEYSKRFIDYLNAYHSRERALKVNSFTKSVKSIHYYDSIVVLEKGKRKEPFTENSGNLSFDDKKERTPLIKKVSSAPLKVVNAISGLFKWRHLN